MSRPKKSDQLLEETKALESRLSELREMMAKEREKREQVPRSNSGGFWRSGKEGTLMQHGKETLEKFKMKQTRSKAGDKASYASERGDDRTQYGDTRERIGTLAQTGSPQVSSGSQAAAPPPPARLIHSSDGEKENKPSPEHPTRRIIETPPEYDGAEVWSAADDFRGSEEPIFQQMPQDDSLLANLTVRPEDFGPAASTPPAGSLLEGAVDEEANRRAFQEALNAWRSGGKTSSLASVGPSKHVTACQPEERADGVQTEPIQNLGKKAFEVKLSRAYRPGGNPPADSYFSKLVKKRPGSATGPASGKVEEHT